MCMYVYITCILHICNTFIAHTYNKHSTQKEILLGSGCTFLLIFIGVYLLYNVVLVSAV